MSTKSKSDIIIEMGKELDSSYFKLIDAFYKENIANMDPLKPDLIFTAHATVTAKTMMYQITKLVALSNGEQNDILELAKDIAASFRKVMEAVAEAPATLNLFTAMVEAAKEAREEITEDEDEDSSPTRH